MRVGIGFLGTGWIVEQVHLPFFSQSACVDRLGIYDLSAARMQEVARLEPSVVCYQSAEELFDDPKIDVVVISTPNNLHSKYVQMALAVGKKVFCEKPICTSEEEALELAPLFASHQNSIFVGLPGHYRQDVRGLKEWMPRLGSIYRIRAGWLRNTGIPRSGWFLDRERSGGGVLMDLGSHVIDLVLWLLDFPTVHEAKAVKSSYFLEQPTKHAFWHGKDQQQPLTASVEDNVSAWIRFGDVACSVELGWAGHSPHDETFFEFYGEHGYLSLRTLFGFSRNTNLTQSELFWHGIDGSEKRHFDLEDRMQPYTAMLSDCMQTFFGGKCPDVLPLQSLRTVKLIDQLYKSS